MPMISSVSEINVFVVYTVTIAVLLTVKMVFLLWPRAYSMKPDYLASQLSLFSLHQSWVLRTMKVAWLLAAFKAIVTCTPRLACSGASCVLSYRSQTEIGPIRCKQSDPPPPPQFLLKKIKVTMKYPLKKEMQQNSLALMIITIYIIWWWLLLLYTQALLV